jgi:DnaJ-class molecular chaperone
MAQNDYYKILGVDLKANQEEIRMAYRRLAFQYHPDRNKEHPEAAVRMKEINEAYAVISDKKKRAEYDAIHQCDSRTATNRFRKKYTERDIYGGSDIYRVFEEFSKTFGLRGFNEIIREVYGPACPPFQGKTNRAARRDTWDPEPPGEKWTPPLGSMTRLLQYTMKKMFGLKWPERGKDRSQRIVIDHKVALLGGKIKINDRREKKELIIKIPARMRDGKQIRLKGMGAPGKNGGEKGDLYIRIHLRRSPLQMIKKALRRF